MDALYMAFPAVAAGILVCMLAQSRRQQAQILRRLHRFEGVDTGEADSRPWLDWLHTAAAPLAGLKEKKRLRGLLLSAGYRKTWAVDCFLVVKCVLFIFGVAASWYWLELSLATLFTRAFDTVKFLGCIFAAARAPDWWLSGQVQRRQARIRATVPQAVDLLTICVEAGVSLEEAFGRVAREIQARAPEIASEFSLTRSEMLLMDRSEALRRMERRSGVREIESLAGSLLQSIQYGTPISEALRVIASDSRARHLSELEEKAGSIGAKVGIPLILLILFPLMALIAAPAAINLIRTFG